MRRVLTVIVPASNEAAWIGGCLEALFASAPVPGGAECIVVANGCRDATAARARAMAGQAQAAGWGLTVLDLAPGGKTLALNAGDRAARGGLRAYLDADVRVSPPLMAQIAAALADDTPRYATGTPRIPAAHSRITRAYARFWQRLPFAAGHAPGFGLFAVNAAGRARWGAWPQIISDDGLARLHFAPTERAQVPASYDWPMVEGFDALVRVRRRQDAGMAELARIYPGLMQNGSDRPNSDLIARLAAADPAGFAAYAAVAVAVRLRRAGPGFTRGR
ncbi:MAG TPA: glycosyltransferase [Paracoccaceae bacterium]|nr:glycosyltransferase [Paracoccaceae bacterium]